jgi:phosphohistidine phosphatase
MKYLTIIRHAKSSWEHPDLDDIARPLNEQGKNAIKIIGKYLQEKHLQPDLIICSPATRALDTAIGISEYVQYDKKKVNIEPAVYFGTSSAILSMLQELDNIYTDVFLFGHEPVLSSMIFQLTKNRLEKFSTCSVYRVSFDMKSWSNICSKKGKCEFYVNPKLLMEK